MWPTQTKDLFLFPVKILKIQQIWNMSGTFVFILAKKIQKLLNPQYRYGCDKDDKLKIQTKTIIV